MVSAANGNTNEIQEESVSGTSAYMAKDQIPLYISTSQRGLLGRKNLKNGFLSIITSLPSRARFMKIGSSGSLISPSGKFRQIAQERDEVSRSVPSSTEGSQEGFSVPFVGKISWVSLKKKCGEWIRDPMNMALLVWIICVAVSGAILFLVMTGMLDRALPKTQRNAWFEVNNQILNALFTLMSLYHHPKRFYHLVLLCRWRPDDILKLRKIYCKNGTYKPHEWMHMMVVVILLHLNCFAQYALCGLNWGYKRSQRPAIGVGFCLAVAISAPAIAGLYSILSPLGKEYELEVDQEEQNQSAFVDRSQQMHIGLKSLEKRYSFAVREDHRVVESRPTWRGGLFDLWDDISVAYLSLFCGFCVFGWNMERLGLGNMYVHIATFLLFCMAPYWIFTLAAINIDNELVREALGVTGIVLCVFGLLYGGFWRIQMRKRFNLPENNFCCGYPSLTDCAQWLCCSMCSLAQEVRTGDFYDVVDDRLYRKQIDDSIQPTLSPLPREDGSPLFRSGPSSPLWSNTSPSRFRIANSPSPTRYGPEGQLPVVDEESSVKGGVMTPPFPASMQTKDKQMRPILKA